MVDRWEPPPLSSREQLAGLEPAVRDAVTQAEEQAQIAYNKAIEAAKHAKELAARARVPAPVEETPQAVLVEEHMSAEGTSEEEEKKSKEDKEKKDEKPILLPVLPCGLSEPVKAMTKSSLARVTDLLQKCDVTAQSPELLVVTWDEVARVISSAGLTTAEVRAAVGAVTGEAAVSLCIKKGSLDLEAWRQRLSKRYLNKDKGSGLTRRLHEARRDATESGVAFLLRLEPLVRGVCLLQLMTPGAALAAVWSVAALGKEYCRANAVYYEKIEKRRARGKIKDMDGLLEAVQGFSEMEDIPKVAAPTVPHMERTEEEKRIERLKKKRADCKKGKHTGHSADNCWVLHPELKPWSRSRGHNSNNSNNNNSASNNEAGRSECIAALGGRDVFVVEAVINGTTTKLGLDSMAALNLIRSDRLPKGVVMSAGGPTLHGVGQAAAKGTIKMDVTLGDLTFAEVAFAVVDDLPVPGLLGKPTLTEMGTVMDLTVNMAEICAGAHKTKVRAIALSAADPKHSRTGPG